MFGNTQFSAKDVSRVVHAGFGRGAGERRVGDGGKSSVELSRARGAPVPMYSGGVLNCTPSHSADHRVHGLIVGCGQDSSCKR